MARKSTGGKAPGPASPQLSRQELGCAEDLAQLLIRQGFTRGELPHAAELLKLQRLVGRAVYAPVFVAVNDGDSYSGSDSDSEDAAEDGEDVASVVTPLARWLLWQARAGAAAKARLPRAPMHVPLPPCEVAAFADACALIDDAQDAAMAAGHLTFYSDETDHLVNAANIARYMAVPIAEDAEPLLQRAAELLAFGERRTSVFEPPSAAPLSPLAYPEDACGDESDVVALEAAAAAKRAAAPAGAATDALVAAAAAVADRASAAAAARASKAGGKAFKASQRLELTEEYASPDALDVLGDPAAFYSRLWSDRKRDLDVLCRLQLHVKAAPEDPYGWNALHYAVAAHNEELVVELLKRGGDANGPEGALGLRPLHLASMPQLRDSEDLENLAATKSLDDLLASVQAGPRSPFLIHLLLRHGAVAGAPVKPPAAAPRAPSSASSLAGLTPLHLLAAWDPLDVDEIVRSFASPELGGIYGGDRLRCQLDAVAELVAAGAPVNAATQQRGDTPLTCAASRGRAMVSALVHAGADPNLARRDGVRPLELALRSYQGPRAALHLLRAGADVLLTAEQAAALAQHADAGLRGDLLLHHIIDATHKYSLVDVAKLMQEVLPFATTQLLEAVLPETGATPLLAAVQLESEAMIELLVSAGADINKGLTVTPFGPPVLLAATFGNMELLQYLIGAGADLSSSFINPMTDYGIVQTAANSNQFDAVVALVQAGASWRLGPGEARVQGGSVFYVPEILVCCNPQLKLSFVEGRLKLAERLHKRREAAAAASLAPLLQGAAPTVVSATVAVALRAGLCSDGKPFTVAQAPQAAVTGGSSSSKGKAPQRPGAQRQQQQAAASADDLDALAAAIEAVGGSSSGTRQASSSSGGSKKQAKKQKQKAKQQQQQQQQQQKQKQRQVASASGSESGEEDEQGDQPPAAAGAAVAAEQPASNSQQQQQLSAAPPPHPSQQQLRPSPPPTQQQQHQQQQQQQQGLDGVQNIASEAALTAVRIQVHAAETAQLVAQLHSYLAACPASSHSMHIQAMEAAGAVLQQHGRTIETCKQLASSCRQAQALAAELGAAGLPALEGAVQALQQQAAAQALAMEHLRGRLAGQLAQLMQQHPLTPQHKQKQELLLQRQQKQQQHQRLMEEAALFACSVDGLVAELAVAAGRSGSNRQGVQQPGRVVVNGNETTVAWPAAVRAAHAAATTPAPAAAAAAAAERNRHMHAAAPQPVAPSAAATVRSAAPTSTAAAPAPAPAGVDAAAAAPAALLQNWRGALPPMFTFNRPPSSGSASSSSLSRPLPAVSAAAAAAAPPASPAGAMQPAAPPAARPAAQSGASSRSSSRRSSGDGSCGTQATLQLQQQQQPSAPPARQPPSPRRALAAADGSVATNGAGKSASNSVRQRKCVVCMERPRDVLLLPCKHVVLCTTCADGLQARGQLDSCPYCRAPIQKRIKVHHA